MDQLLIVALLAKARQGDKQARDELIQLHLNLVRNIVRRQSERFSKLRHSQDDLFSQGCVVLTMEIDRIISDPSIENVGAYLRTAIRHAILKYEDEDEIIGACHSTKKTRRKHCDERPSEPLVRNESIDLNEVTDDWQSANDLLRDIIERCATDRQRQIILLRSEGLNDGQIADRLKVTAETVRRDRRLVERSFLSPRQARRVAESSEQDDLGA